MWFHMMLLQICLQSAYRLQELRDEVLQRRGSLRSVADEFGRSCHWSIIQQKIGRLNREEVLILSVVWA
jgi:hypothetical protein